MIIITGRPLEERRQLHGLQSRLQLVVLRQPLEPRQVAEDAVHHEPTEGLEVVRRRPRPAGRRRDRAELHRADVAAQRASAGVRLRAAEVDNVGHDLHCIIV